MKSNRTITVDVDYSELEQRVLTHYAEALPSDITTERAAKYYGVPFNQVTDQQRKAMKDFDFIDRYSCTGRIPRRPQ